MADTKLTGLTANTTPALTDLVYLVDDPGGSPLSQKITVADLIATPSPTLVTPIVSGSLTLGVQGTGAVPLKVAHAASAGGEPSAYYGIFPSTATWTNNGTYYDHTAMFGWNGDIAQADEPDFGLALESKYSQGSGQPFGVELHHQFNFRDATAVRAFGCFVDRAAPHLATTSIAGRVVFSNSATDVAAVTNSIVTEQGNWELYHGSPFIINNYANGASNTGKGAFQITSSDSFPDIRWSKSGAIKALINGRLDDGGVTIDVGYVSGGYLLVNGGFVDVVETETITGAVTDGYASALKLAPTYTAATAKTVTRHNYINVANVVLAGVGPAALTNAAVFRFNAALGTHKATVAASTKITPGGVDGWIKHNVDGTIMYSPLYLSTTA